MCRYDRSDPFRCRRIVEQDVAAAIDLDIDKAGRQPGAVRQILHWHAAWQVAPRHHRGDRAGFNDDDVVTMRGRAVEHRISGDRVTCGAFHRVRVIACG